MIKDKTKKAEYDRNRRATYSEQDLEKARLASRKAYSKNREKNIQRIENIRLRRKAILDQIKIEAGCMDCGYNQHSEALEFDHRPGTNKIFELGIAHKFSAAKVEAEMAKCDIVCSNCHRVRTAKRRHS